MSDFAVSAFYSGHEITLAKMSSQLCLFLYLWAESAIRCCLIHSEKNVGNLGTLRMRF